MTRVCLLIKLPALISVTNETRMKHGFEQVTIRVLLALVAILFSTSTSFAADVLVGAAFQRALDAKAGRAWTGVTIREAVREITAAKQIAILLDRRIDPTLELNLSVPLVPVRTLLSELAATANARTIVVGNVVYIGSDDATLKLRKVIDLRRDELRKLGADAGSSKTSKTKPVKSPWQARASTLLQQRSFTWEELERPRDLVMQIAKKFQIDVEGVDNLPHDLWAAGALPQATAVEALSLVLVQFGMTFEFLPDRAAVRIVPIPDVVPMARSDAPATGRSKSECK